MAGRKSTQVLSGSQISRHFHQQGMAGAGIRNAVGLDRTRGLAGHYSFVSSRMVKEVFSFGGDIAGLVPPDVLKHLRGRMGKS
jgi:pantetheine-phosphate adenylyltransferase